ncbi:hypothetical protein [Natranaerofaba carboxydovora]|uniref:hypothetical protein n=1 Tax=Natranaerofaba carboxydovora TaxID=2742683 RepID=UPI001F12A821|nr:hypothetical protein [Natranaerofaba carboxydovora]UMZ73549.1 hypothetical protein ACONDI_01103 [Natranaerofaba carboxydovora]
MYKINSKKAEKIEPVTFSKLGVDERQIEELLRCNIDMLCDEEESMLIVGSQVKNEKRGRSDLTAVDQDGSLVLIEIKRDIKDIENRTEAFEFQAIRYAASYATIEDTDDLVKKVFVPYIEKYRNEFPLGELTSYELASRKLTEFLRVNDAENNFNKKQKIILVASDYDEQTLSAVAWLNNNGVDINCFKLVPYLINEEVYLHAEKVLPLTDYDDYYINLLDKTTSTVKQNKSITRRSLPKIDTMLKWGVVKAGDIIVAKNHPDEAILLENGNVDVNGKELSLQKWLKQVFGWSSVQTYMLSVHKESGKTLSQIRREYMDKQSEKVD